MSGLLERLRAIAPEQYYYDETQLHITILSLFTATHPPEPYLAQRSAYTQAADAALRDAQPFRALFEGLTASAGTVMIQGFARSRALDDLRDRLRCQLRARGLGAKTDERYRLQTAHMTAVRFRNPLRQSREFAQMISEARSIQFGESTLSDFILVENDWYMSPGATRLVKRYSARSSAVR